MNLWVPRGGGLVLVVSSSVLQSRKSSLTAMLTEGSTKAILFGYFRIQSKSLEWGMKSLQTVSSIFKTCNCYHMTFYMTMTHHLSTKSSSISSGSPVELFPVKQYNVNNEKQSNT